MSRFHPPPTSKKGIDILNDIKKSINSDKRAYITLHGDLRIMEVSLKG
jgi:hypothetical protein